MTADIDVLTLTGLAVDQDKTDLRRGLVGSADFHDEAFLAAYDGLTLFYDCFLSHDGGGIVLVGPPFLNFRPLLDDAAFQVDGSGVEVREIKDLSRCSILTLDHAGGQVLDIQHPNFSGQMDIGRSFVPDFTGLNGLYTISLNNRLEWIEDWLNYYVRMHGANAVVLADNGSTDYSLSDLASCIAGVEGLEKAAILDARFPFGPTAENKTAYSALFLQRSLAELGRLRFFARSRAVLNSDIDELFHSKSGASVYDRAVQSEAGYVRADARWVYADMDGRETFPRHRDHRWVSASGKPRSNRKWCVVPDGPQRGRQWLTHFLGNRKDPVDPDLLLWHFRHVTTNWKYAREDETPDLIADPELSEAMETAFPSPDTPALPRVAKGEPTPDDGKIAGTSLPAPDCLIATCMKDEGPFILEWLAWHKSIGIKNFVVFTNDCTDGTVEILDRLDALGELRHLANPALVSGSTYFQPAALSYIPLLPEWRRASHFISIDVDEFINVRAGKGHIHDLFAATGPFDALSMSELNHGSNSQVTFEPGFVTEQFPLHQTERPGRHKALRGVKTITRISDRLDMPRNHRPDFREDVDDLVWLDGSGRALDSLRDDASLNGIDVRGTYDLVVLDHFPLRSLESFLIKMFRGDVVIKDKSASQRYWRLRNRNDVQSSTFERQRPEFHAYYQKLISDPKLSALHKATCNFHTERAAELLEIPRFRERKDWILGNAWD